LVYISLPVLVPAMIFVYASFNPAESELFPKCFFHSLTGFKCPGCGSQRAIHHLLNGEVAAAWRMNQLLIVSIPYIILGYAVELLQKRYAWALTVRKKLYGVTAVWIAFGVIVCFAVLRNLW
jgi:hypothetical protein